MRQVVEGIDIIPGLDAPISWAVVHGDVVYTSGVYGRDVGRDYWGDIREQTRMCLGYIDEILRGSKSSVSNVLQVTVYLKDREDFDAYNEEYRQFFGEGPPARTTIVTDFVFPEMLIEISCVAALAPLE